MLLKNFLSLFLIFGILISCLHSQPAASNATNHTRELALNVDTGVTPPLVINGTIYNPANYQITIDTDAGSSFHPDPDSGALLAPLNQNQRAPYNGVLLNGAALAFIETEYSRQQQQCMLDRTTDAALLRERARRDISYVESSLNIARQEFAVETRTQTQEINRLTAANQSALRYQTWLPWFMAGSFVVGVGLTALFVYALH